MMTVTALCLLLLLPVAAEAQIVAPPKAKSEIVVQGRLAPVETVSDSELESRLQAVFSHIDELKGIHTTVQDGVVTLSGKIVSSKSGQLAN